MTVDRMQELVAYLNEMAYRYYTLDEPTIADAEYDRLYDELVRLEAQTGERLPDSPTRRVGGTARRSESSEMSFRRSSLISEAGRYSPGSVLARFSTQV